MCCGKYRDVDRHVSMPALPLMVAEVLPGPYGLQVKLHASDGATVIVHLVCVDDETLIVLCVVVCVAGWYRNWMLAQPCWGTLGSSIRLWGCAISAFGDGWYCTPNGSCGSQAATPCTECAVTANVHKVG